MSFFKEAFAIFLNSNSSCKPYFQRLTELLFYGWGICCQAGTSARANTRKANSMDGGFVVKLEHNAKKRVEIANSMDGGFVVKLELQAWEK